MAIYQNSSRYRLTSGASMASRVPEVPRTYYSHTARDGDTFQLLAAKLFNDSSRYWEIADINPQVQWPDVIPTGTVLRIPK
jgi:nucleoid-associated protein YgaU